MFELKTERLRLVPLDLDNLRLMLGDLRALERNLGTIETHRVVARALKRAVINSIVWSEEEPEQYLWYTHWQIIVTDENRIIGSAGFKGCPNQQGEVEIGYGLDRPYRNRGYTTEAVTALVQWALRQPGIRAVTAETVSTNIPSLRVLQKVGMVPDRATSEYLYWRTSDTLRQRLQPPCSADGSDEFELYDLAVVVERIEGHCTCNMRVGDRFYMRGGKIALPDGSDFCLYALQAAIPLLPARQRRNHPADWMETDSRVTCPDPACRLIMRIDRVGVRTLRHDDVSPIPWNVKRET